MFSTSKLIEVNANGLWDEPDHVNARFCQEQNRATGSEGSLFFMDGTNYPEKLQEAVEFGCTPEFINAYQLALNLGADFVMFFHDV